MGRNVTNLLGLANFKNVDGVDISAENIRRCRETFDGTKSTFYLTRGYDFYDDDTIESEQYDFVMSTITFEHICVHDIRFSLMEEIYRVLKPGGLFSLQMGFGPTLSPFKNSPYPLASYYENLYSATSSNSGYDVRVTDAKNLTDDIYKIGFTNCEVDIIPNWQEATHPQWIIIHARK